jgi:glycosyltransferase involved in cell wall biosynthesis
MPGFAGGGAERATIQLAASFGDLGVDTELVVPTADGPLLPLANDMLQSSRIVDLRTGRVRKSVPALARYLRRRQPDVLLASPDDTAFFAHIARRLAGSRHTILVSVIHNTLTLQTAALGPKRLIVTRALKWVLPRADLVVCVSSGVRDDLVSLVHLEVHPVVIPDPIDVAAVARSSREPVAHPWFDGKTQVVLGVGRLTWQKNFEMLIRAFHLLKRDVPEAKLLILGEGELRPRLEALVTKLGLATEVDLHGFVDSPWSYMARSNILAMSSRFEGLGLVLVEALACGIPVVSTDCPSGPAEVLDRGRLGTLTPVDDAQAMAAALVDVLSNPPKRADLTELESIYAPDRVAKEFLTALESARRTGGKSDQPPG